MQTNTTHFFMFWKSRWIQYVIETCHVIPNCESVVIVLHEDIIFVHQTIIKSIPTQQTITREALDHFSFASIDGRISSEIQLNILSNRKRASSGHHFYTSLTKLLREIDQRYIENLDHSNWASDCLGLKSFLLEISCSTLNQCKFFHSNVISQCPILGYPLQLLANTFHQNCNNQITHKLLCPLLCLKHHNLMFGVFSYHNRQKETLFYVQNPLSNMIETKKYTNFVRLVDCDETLYLYSGHSWSECFIPDVPSGSTLQNPWRLELSITGKFSHISPNAFESYLKIIQITYDANIFMNHEGFEDYQLRPEYPICIIK